MNNIWIQKVASCLNVYNVNKKEKYKYAEVLFTSKLFFF